MDNQERLRHLRVIAHERLCLSCAIPGLEKFMTESLDCKTYERCWCEPPFETGYVPPHLRTEFTEIQWISKDCKCDDLAAQSLAEETERVQNGTHRGNLPDHR